MVYRSIFLILIALVSGCVQRELVPNFVSPSFKAGTSETVYILHPVDLRQDRSASAADIAEVMLDPSGWPRNLRKPIKALKDKGYNFQIVRSRRLPNVTEDLLASPDANWVAELKPDRARFVLVIALTDLATTGGFGTSWSASCSGYLYDKKARLLVWRHDEILKISAGGLIGLAVDDATRRDVMQNCSLEMLMRLPERQSS